MSTQKLLYIECSPMEERSYSSKAAKHFIDHYLLKNPLHSIEHLNLFSENLPEFNKETADQKYKQVNALLSGQEKPAPTPAWDGVLKLINQLKSADKVLISAPMWNFSIPYKLKHYIDIICQPGETFWFDTKTFDYVGLVTDKPLQLILASSSEYPPTFPHEDGGTKQDYQSTYLKHVMKFIGFEDINMIKIQPTTAAPKDLDKMFEKKLLESEQAALTF